MIARTSATQGLTDIGTLSLVLRGPTGSNVEVNSATFQFDWRNAANDAALAGSNEILFTAYDIDFTQRNRIPTSDYSFLGTSVSPVTRLTTSTSLGTTAVFDPGPGTGATFTDARNAYAFTTVVGDDTQTISVDKLGGGGVNAGYGVGGNQVYMYSFRSPSPLLPGVPEPTSAIIASLGALTLLRRRRA